MAEPSVKDLAYRAMAGVLGGPVDLASMVMRPFGYTTPENQVFGSSEYIGQKMEDVGLVGSARSPIMEFISSMAVPTPGGFAKGAAMAGPMIGGMFVGKGSKTWDVLSAEKAKIMADLGTDARTIWKETGTWKGPDGKWRQEIDDRAATAQFTHLPESGTQPLAERALEHSELFNAYPDLKDVRHLGLRENIPRGSTERFGTSSMMTSVGPSEKSLKSTALHETQHVIQNREGFARGGNPAMFTAPTGLSAQVLTDAAILDKTMRATNLSQLEALQRFETLFKRKPEAGAFAALESVGTGKELELARDVAIEAEKRAKNPTEAYRRLAGEAEARATQKRMDMTAKERRATFPEDSYDVPIEELIVRID
jgi:hypothetical protein